MAPSHISQDSYRLSASLQLPGLAAAAHGSYVRVSCQCSPPSPSVCEPASSSSPDIHSCMQRQLHLLQGADSWSRSPLSISYISLAARLPAAAVSIGTSHVRGASSLFRHHAQKSAGRQARDASRSSSRFLPNGLPLAAADRQADEDMDGYGYYTRSEAIQVTLAIGQTTTLQQLSALYEQHKLQLWDINIAAIFRQLSKLLQGGAPLRSLEHEDMAQLEDLYKQLAYTAAKAAHSMRPRELCTIASAAAQLGFPHVWLCDALADASQPHLCRGRVTLRQAAQLTYAFGKMGFMPAWSWLQALLHATQPLIADAAVHAGLAAHRHDHQSDAVVTNRQQAGRARAARSPARVTEYDVPAGQQTGAHTEQRGQQHARTSQATAQAVQGSQQNVNGEGSWDGTSQSLANLMHALACRMRVMPSTQWLHTWLLATQQCLLVPAHVKAAELVQMLQALESLVTYPEAAALNGGGSSSYGRGNDSSSHDAPASEGEPTPSNGARQIRLTPSNDMSQNGGKQQQPVQQHWPGRAGADHTRRRLQHQNNRVLLKQEQWALTASQLRQLLLDTGWIDSCCVALQHHVACMTPSMAKAALHALAAVAKSNHHDSAHVQEAAHALLLRARTELPVSTGAQADQQQQLM